METKCNQHLEPTGVILGKSTRILGKVVLTPEGSYDNTREYDYLCLVYDENTKSSFISKKHVPAGTPLTDTEYWQPINDNGDVSTFSDQLRSLNTIGSPNTSSLLLWDTTNNTFEWIEKPYTKAEVDALMSHAQESLTFDTTPTAGSNNPVYSWAIKDYVDNHQTVITVDDTPTEGSSNPVSSDGVYDALAGKQDVISDLATIRSNASNAYQKPSSGIPSSDMSGTVQAALNKANTAVQSADMANYVTQSDVDSSISDAMQNVVYFGDVVGSANYTISDEPDSDHQTVSAAEKAAWNAKADDSAVVHKTGGETISGNKTFSGNVLFETYIETPQPETPGEGEEGEEPGEDDLSRYDLITITGEKIHHIGHTDFSWIATNDEEVVDENEMTTLQSVLDSLTSRIAALEAQLNQS